MSDNLWQNEYTRVWIEDPRINGTKMYGSKVGIPYIEIKEHSIEVRLEEMLTKTPGNDSALLQSFEIGNHIIITYCEIGRPDVFENNTPILILRNCSFVESYIIDSVILESSQARPVNMILIAESWDYEWSKND